MSATLHPNPEPSKQQFVGSELAVPLTCDSKLTANFIRHTLGIEIGLLKKKRSNTLSQVGSSDCLMKDARRGYAHQNDDLQAWSRGALQTSWIQTHTTAVQEYLLYGNQTLLGWADMRAAEDLEKHSRSGRLGRLLRASPWTGCADAPVLWQTSSVRMGGRGRRCSGPASVWCGGWPLRTFPPTPWCWAPRRPVAL